MLDTAQEDALWENYFADPSAQNQSQLMEFYTPLVRDLAWRLTRRLPLWAQVNSGYDDFVQEGLLALWLQIPKRDRSSSVRFWSFAFRRVNGAMVDHRREFDPVPRNCTDRDNSHKVRSLYGGDKPHDVQDTRERLQAEDSEEEFLSALKEFCPQLSDLERDVLVRMCHGGLSQIEVSRELNFSGGYITYILNEVRAKVNDRLASIGSHRAHVPLIAMGVDELNRRV